MEHRKLKKVFIVIFCVAIITAMVVILFVSPITKYLVERYDEKFTGRQITMDWAYVNPFTGYLHFSNLKIYEYQSDSIFFSANSLSANFSILKMLSKTYEITELTLDHPKGIIIQDKMNLNIVDMVKRFTPEKTDTFILPVHFNILNIKIKNGEFNYWENAIPIDYFIKELNFESTGKLWNSDTVAGTFSFKAGTGTGDIKGDFTLNLKTLDYRYAVVIKKLDLKIIEQYLKEITNYRNFSANLDADMKATGNMADEEDVTAKGMLAINDFHLGKSPGNDYVSFDKFTMAIREMSPLKHKYLYDSVSLSRPYIKYELYDKSDNIETMFGKKGANISAVQEDPDRFNLILEIARYVKVLARNFFSSYYKIDRLAIYGGDIKFNDYSINEKFSTDLNPLFVTADSIDKNHKRVNVIFKSGIQPYGNASVALSINPNDSADFDMNYHFQKIPVSAFNPYMISYTSFPLDRGTVELNGSWNVRKGIIRSDNHLLIIDPRVTKRMKNNDTKWLPLPLIMSFIRERSNVIDYEIPITGNLKNPKFHFHDVLFDLLGNIFIKPATTPYRSKVKRIETEIEKALTLKWEMRQHLLFPKQEKFVERITDFLVKNPEASIAVSPRLYVEKEKEYILFFEAKKKYFLSRKEKDAQFLTEDDSEKVNKMSVKDSLFVHYVDKQVNDDMLFSIQEKCEKLIGSSVVNAKQKQLNKERENSFISVFKVKGVESRVKFNAAENTIPYNGFSFYKIEYKGEIPEALRKAYRQMNELNDETPRKEFQIVRRKNKSGI